MYVLLHQSDYKTTAWSGGDSVEILIFPVDTTFKEKNFDLRISRAMLYKETSEFTYLPGYTRDLVNLAGHVTLRHEETDGMREVQMDAFKTDHFSGDDRTTSHGSGADFNFIYKNNLTTDLKIIQHQDSKKFYLEPYTFHLIHCVTDLMEIEIIPENDYFKDEVVLKDGDSLLIFNETATFNFNSASIMPDQQIGFLCSFDTLHNREDYQAFIDKYEALA